MNGTEKQIKWAEDIKANAMDTQKIHDIRLAIQWTIDTNHSWMGDKGTPDNIVIANKLAQGPIENIEQWEKETEAHQLIENRNNLGNYNNFAPADVPHAAAAVKMIIKAWAKTYAPTIKKDVEARFRSAELAGRDNNITRPMRDLISYAIDGRISCNIYSWAMSESIWKNGKLDKWWR